MIISSFIKRKRRVSISIKKSNKENRPVIKVFKSNKNLYLSLLLEGNVAFSFSTLNHKGLTTKEKVNLLAKDFSSECINRNFSKFVFDKGPYSYGGKVKLLADSCREMGLIF